MKALVTSSSRTRLSAVTACGVRAVGVGELVHRGGEALNVFLGPEDKGDLGAHRRLAIRDCSDRAGRPAGQPDEFPATWRARTARSAARLLTRVNVRMRVCASMSRPDPAPEVTPWRSEPFSSTLSSATSGGSSSMRRCASPSRARHTSSPSWWVCSRRRPTPPWSTSRSTAMWRTCRGRARRCVPRPTACRATSPARASPSRCAAPPCRRVWWAPSFARHARYADISLFGKPDDSGLWHQTVDTTLFESGKPVLICPPGAKLGPSRQARGPRLERRAAGGPLGGRRAAPPRSVARTCAS